MERRELNRMFDRLAPSPEQEQAVLDRLLQTERKDFPVKKLKKLTVVGIAAALMVISCAAAVVTGIDQRLLDYFGATPEQTEQLATTAATLDPVSHTYNSGWTVEISQVLSDRYMAAALIDFTAPEGTVLPTDEWLTLMVDYRIEDKDGNLIGSFKDAPHIPCGFDEDDGRPLFYVGTWNGKREGDGLADCEFLDGGDLEQGRISVLWKYMRGTAFQGFAGDELLGARLSIIPKGIDFRGAYETIYFGEEDALWSYDLTLSENDSGRFYTMDTPLMLGENSVQLQTIYLSPLELAYEFTPLDRMPSDGLRPLYDREAQRYAIHMADGSAVTMKENFAHHSKTLDDGRGIDHVSLYPVEFIDPSQAVSFSMFGQTFELK